MSHSYTHPSRLRSATAAALLATALLTGLAATPSARAQLIYGIGGTDTGAGPNAAAYTLFSFDAAAPGTTTTLGTITPSAGFALESIAFQPSTGQLYGFQFNGTNNTGQIVTINRANGALAALAMPVTIGSIANSGGDSAAISFNPSNGAIRLVTGTYGNYRFSAAGAFIAQDANVAYAPGDKNVANTLQVSTIAYITGPTLYDIDYINNYLTTQSLTAGSIGQLTSVGNGLGITATQGSNSEGFTITGTGQAFLNATDAGDGGAVRDRLYSVNLTTGAAAPIGLIGASTTFNTVDIAAFVPEPGTWAMVAVGGLGLLGWTRQARRRAC